MDPNLAPPAPPPLPVTPSHNPYDFITQPSAPVRRSWLPGGNSKKKRILIIAIGAFILLLMVVGVVGLLGSGDDGLKADYVSLAQQQAELIRVSDIGISKARGTEAKNLAVTTKYSILSEQTAILSQAKKARAQTDPKIIAAGKDNKTDTQLTTASQTNQFDEVFIKIMKANLKKYQQTLKKVHDETTDKKTRDVLSQDYANAALLIGEPKQ
ncbi:MAG TPA: hypothetical protein VM124_03460 [Candidatus Limnocylindrales bacterium]|nr:hypothetical protein [Candidatus Limnocylindrales bacterium]